VKWIDALPEKRRRGSFPRCLCFMTGDRMAVASRLTALVDLPQVRIEVDDFWMPSPVLNHKGEFLRSSIEEAMLLDSTRAPKRNSQRNHRKIGEAIGGASAALGGQREGWNLSRDSHYQIANRFARSWKLASIGIPVVLVYVGFLGVTEMKDHGDSFVDYGDWSRVLLNHSRNCVPESVWGREVGVGGCCIRPLIRAMRQELLPLK